MNDREGKAVAMCPQSCSKLLRDQRQEVQITRTGEEFVRYGAEAGIISEGVAQVIDDRGNPRPGGSAGRGSILSLFVPLRLTIRGLVAYANTYLTPGPCHRAPIPNEGG